jgi:hypothetical protein
MFGKMFGEKTVGYGVEMEFESCEPELNCHTLVEPARDSETSQPIIFFHTFCCTKIYRCQYCSRSETKSGAY